MRHLLRSLVPLALLESFALPHPATACSCGWDFGADQPCESYWTYQEEGAVFIGRAVSVSEIADADMMYPGPRLRYRFEVIEAFHGVEGPTADVVTGRGGGDCGYEFRLGESYFLYAGMTGKGEYSVWICGPTKRLARAKADVAYARQVAREEARTGLYGRVVHVERESMEDSPSSEGLGGILVRIEGPGGQRYSARTDDRGDFRIQGKLEGSYTVHTELPGDFPPVEEQQVEVPAGRCAGVEIEVDPEG